MAGAECYAIVNGVPAHDSEHVMAATNVRRGDTPAVWKDGQADGYAGKWDAVNPGGPADFGIGEIDGHFHRGGDPWIQV